MIAAFLLFAMITTSANTKAVAPSNASTASANTSSTERIVRAQSTHNKIFVAYVVVLALTVVGTYFVWSSGNAAQRAIQDASNAETEVAKQKASEADARAGIAEESAGKANIRAGEIEKSNLDLRTQVANLEIQALDAKKDVARLQKDATDAKAAQQKVETQLAAQQERAARAEQSLLELQEKVKWRSVSKWQKDRFIEITKNQKKGEVEIMAKAGDPEAIAYANELMPMLQDAGWTVPPVEVRTYFGAGEIGLFLQINSFEALKNTDPSEPNAVWIPDTSPIEHGAALNEALDAVGIKHEHGLNQNQPENSVVLIVGTKP